MIGSKKSTSEKKITNRIGIGTVQLGLPYGPDNEPPPTETESITLLREAFDLGIDFMDTASAYGKAEYLLGKTFENCSDRPLIATKFSLLDSTNIEIVKKNIIDQLENSKKLLHLDTLPLVMLHSVVGDIYNPPLLDFLFELTTKHIVEKWGVTTYGFCAPLRVLEHPKIFSTIQLPFNVLDRVTLSALRSQPNAHNFTVIARSIFLQGLLTEKYSSISKQLLPLKPIFDVLKELAQCSDLSLSELCLRYAGYKPGIGITLFGTQSLTELRKNLIHYSKGPLDNDIIEFIDDIVVERLDLLDPRNWK
ncbi:MAG: aldo/keto reductase [Candidatus Latescibacterota bacterium]|nr:aldo/keto reductase [Candidatus Latescibacterota bacterium]